MSGSLGVITIGDLGVNGLNTQTSSVSLKSSWLTLADNIMIKESGKLTTRKGVKQITTALSSGKPIGAVIDNEGVVIATSENKLYVVDLTAPTNSWASSHTVSGASDDWQLVPFNGKTYAFQAGQIPLEYSGSWAAFTDKPSGVTTFNPSCGIGFYGRLWVGGVNGKEDVLYYSDTLIGTTWSNPAPPAPPTAAGAIDMKTVWGNDEIVAVAAFFGKLAIFGKQNIAIYNNPSDPTTMELDEVIRGVGCIGRDTVHNVGDDLIYVSRSGLMSLQRTAETDKVPLSELSYAVKDELVAALDGDPKLKACYSLTDGLYLLSIVDRNTVYVFDTKALTEAKNPRVTKWSFESSREPSSLTYSVTRGLLIGQAKGALAVYDGYIDRELQSNNTYLQYGYEANAESTWLGLSQEARVAILKKLKIVVEGGKGGILSIKYFKDYNSTANTFNSFDLDPQGTGSPSLFGGASSLYGAAKYAPKYSSREYSGHMSGVAENLKIRVTLQSEGSVTAIQNIKLYMKAGNLK